MIKNSRIALLDFLKGIAIIAVAFYHLGGGTAIWLFRSRYLFCYKRVFAI